MDTHFSSSLVVIISKLLEQHSHILTGNKRNTGASKSACFCCYINSINIFYLIFEVGCCEDINNKTTLQSVIFICQIS